MDNQSKIILIAGPTASGKSNFAVKLAKKIDGGEIRLEELSTLSDDEIANILKIERLNLWTLKVN